MKKPMDDLTKAKLMYCGELALFAVVFVVLGVLFLTETITVGDWKKWVFGIGTLAGGAWLVADLLLTILSPTRRAKNSLLDKILVAPMGLTVFVFDIIALFKGWLPNPEGTTPFRYMIGIALCYYAVAYVVQVFYHWKHPLPMLIEAVEEERREAAVEAAEENKSEEESGEE